MGQPVVHSVFRRNGINTYRDSAFIQFGNAETSLGATVLLNPGAAGSNDSRVQTALESNEYFSGTVDPDPTMRQLIEFVNAVYDRPNGRLHIYNLFSLQGTNAMKAIEAFELLASAGTYAGSNVPPLTELREHPWVMIGWGLKAKDKWRHLQGRRMSWIDALDKAKIPYFGKPHPKVELAYYHVCPLLVKQREVMLHHLVTAYTALV